jgi:hypothetical protein
MTTNYQDRIRQSLIRWQRKQMKATKDKHVGLSDQQQAGFNFDERKEDRENGHSR